MNRNGLGWVCCGCMIGAVTVGGNMPRAAGAARQDVAGKTALVRPPASLEKSRI